MTTKIVGEFELEVRGPHPCWITIKRGETELTFRHDDLRDLEFVVATAIREANDRLGPSENIDGRIHRGR